jgi:hypothetical protein
MAHSKRFLRHYLWSIIVRELSRSRMISAEAKVGVIALAGLLMSPFVVGSFVWWLLTGKRLPGRLGRWLPPPGAVIVHPFPKQLPADVREWFATRDSSS